MHAMDPCTQGFPVLSSATGGRYKRKPEWIDEQGHDLSYQQATPGGYAQPREEDVLDLTEVITEGSTKRLVAMDAPRTPLLGGMGTCVNIYGTKGALQVTPFGRFRWSAEPNTLVKPKR